MENIGPGESLKDNPRGRGKLVKRNERLHLKQLTAQLPKHFPWKLLSHLVDDLSLSNTVGASRLFNQSSRALISSLKAAIRSRDYETLRHVSADLSPRSMLEIGDAEYDEFYILYQLGALLKKYPFEGKDTATPALQTFRQFERTAHLYNCENYKALIAMSEKHPDYLGIIEEIRGDILRCIGAVPSLPSVYGNAKHGPGTAVGLNGKDGEVTTYFSWLPPYTVSPKCLPYAKQAIMSYPQWIGALMDDYREKSGVPQYAPIDMEKFWDSIFEVVDYCKYASVPKTAETDRSIAIEPALNVYLQLGCDRIIRSRLKKRWHVDLSTQDKNQQLAFKGSLDDDSVTIDLKGASETVTLMLCMILLPEGWYDLLTDLRSEKILIDGECSPLAKMSAMGNGFTFALESLIFAALVRCAMRRTRSIGETAVYGDDIVVPKTAAKYLIQLLSLAGFTINEDKSFVGGPFRESCGKDYYRGQLVRPFFLKNKVSTVLDLFYIHNSLCVLEENLPWAWDVSFHKTKQWLKSFIPPRFRCVFGPYTECLDSHLFSKRRLFRVSPYCVAYHAVIASAKIYNKDTSFFFRRLMKTYQQTPIDKWDEARNLTTGSAFDVTKRGRIVYRQSVQLAWI